MESSHVACSIGLKNRAGEEMLRHNDETGLYNNNRQNTLLHKERHTPHLLATCLCRSTRQLHDADPVAKPRCCRQCVYQRPHMLASADAVAP